MKKCAILVLGITIALTILMTSSAAANQENQIIWRASGQILRYADPQPENLEVIGGSWTCRVTGTHDWNIEFKLSYKEVNLTPEGEEGPPYGSINTRTITLIDGYLLYPPLSGELQVFGHFDVEEVVWNPKDTIPPVEHKSSQIAGDFVIFVPYGPYGLSLVTGTKPYCLIGSTTNYSNKLD